MFYYWLSQSPELQRLIKAQDEVLTIAERYIPLSELAVKQWDYELNSYFKNTSFGLWLKECIRMTRQCNLRQDECYVFPFKLKQESI